MHGRGWELRAAASRAAGRPAPKEDQVTEAEATPLDAGAPVGQTSGDCYDAATHPPEAPAAPRPERDRQPGSTRPMNAAPPR